MKTKTKALIGIMLALVVAVSLVSNVLTVEADSEQSDEALSQPARERLWQFVMRLQAQNRKAAAAIWLFREAEAVTIDGIVITHFRNILVIESEGERLNVVLPQVWNMNSEIVNVSQMFQHYISVGDLLSINALQREVTNKKGVTFTAILAYEITDGEYEFYAVLPFNIDTGD